MSAIHPALYRAARTGIYEDSQSEIEDTVRASSEWLADMLDDYAKELDDENVRVGVHRAATQVRCTGGVR